MFLAKATYWANNPLHYEFSINDPIMTSFASTTMCYTCWSWSTHQAYYIKKISSRCTKKIAKRTTYIEHAKSKWTLKRKKMYNKGSKFWPWNSVNIKQAQHFVVPIIEKDGSCGIGYKNYFLILQNNSACFISFKCF